jgi:DNA polymerase-4
LKIKTADFKRYTRSQTLSGPVRDSETIYRTAVELLNAFGLKRPVRLIGVGVGGFSSEYKPVQYKLFPTEEEKGTNRKRWENVDRALDAIGDRFGGETIKRGTLATKPKRTT